MSRLSRLVVALCCLDLKIIFHLSSQHHINANGQTRRYQHHFFRIIIKPHQRLFHIMLMAMHSQYLLSLYLNQQRTLGNLASLSQFPLTLCIVCKTGSSNDSSLSPQWKMRIRMNAETAFTVSLSPCESLMTIIFILNHLPSVYNCGNFTFQLS